MGDLVLDVLDGSVDVRKANAACKAADVMLKAISIQVQAKVLADKRDVSMVRQFLASSKGPQKPAIIASELAMDPDRVADILLHEGFDRVEGGYCVAGTSGLPPLPK